MVRQTNEDSYICDPPNLFIVADGMGGHVAGEIASKLAVNTVRDFLLANAAEETDQQNALKEAILAANISILNEAENHAEYAGMGTTISMLYIRGNDCFWGHVGDSRIYLLRGGAMTQITKDHSLVWDLVETGMITEEESLTHPQRNMLTRAIGVEETIRIDTGRVALAANDRFLLCTDGLTNMVSDDAIKSILSSCDQTEESVEILVRRAMDAGGVDNITALLAENR